MRESFLQLFKKKVTIKIVALLLLLSLVLSGLMGIIAFKISKDKVNKLTNNKLTIFNERVDIRIRTITTEMEELALLFSKNLRIQRDACPDSFDFPNYTREKDKTIRVSDKNTGFFVPINTKLSLENQKLIAISKDYYKTVMPFVYLSFLDIFYISVDNILIVNPPGTWMQDVEVDFNAMKYPFYYPASPKFNPTKKPVWTPIYFDKTLDLWMTSLLIPDYVNDIFKGVNGNDFPLDNIINEFITIANNNPNVTPVIFNSKGEMIFHPDHIKRINNTNANMGAILSNSKDLMSNFQTTVSNRINENLENRLFHFNIKDKEYSAIITPLNFLDWQLVSYTSTDEANKNIKTEFLGLIVFLFLFISFIAVFITFGIKYLILNRIIKLKEISENYLDNPDQTFEISGDDEISGLAHSFTKLAHNLKKRTELENIINLVFKYFINVSNENIDIAIENSLKLLGNFSNSDRAYLFKYSKSNTKLHNTHEWCNLNIPSEKEFYADIDATKLEEINTSILAKQVHIIKSREELAEGSLKNSMATASGNLGAIKSLICCPIIRKNSIYGFIGLDSVHEFMEWGESDIQTLSIIGQIISDAVLKLENEEKMHQVKKMDAIGQLAGGIAHDFNNMLGGIMAAAQLLKSPKRTIDKKGLEFVDLILDASNKAAGLTAQLLAFGRKTITIYSSINIHTVIDETLALFNRTLNKNISIILEKHALDVTIKGDSGAIQNIIMNLGINASHAMPDGGNLTISTKNIILDNNYCNASNFEIEQGEYVVIEVRDEGSGIPAELLEKIFEPFFTTKEQGKGTGLGLASVYGTVLDHNGAIYVYSEINSGTVFHIYLPCTLDSQKKYKVDDTMIVHGTGHILLVDDELIIRTTAKHLLEEMGYTVTLAVNGNNALSIFKEQHNKIDLILMDMIMPEMDGKATFYKMKEIDPNCKIIIASGFTKDKNLDQLLKDDLKGFIGKPYKSEDLSKLIIDTLNS